MNKFILTFSILAAAASAAGATSVINNNVQINDLNFRRVKDHFDLEMTVDASRFHVNQNREYYITPTLVSADGRDSIEMKPILLSGRNLYFRHLRNDDFTADDGIMVRGGKEVTYNSKIDSEDWMNNSVLKLNVSECGCCDALQSVASTPVATYRKISYSPVYGYARAAGDSIKERLIEGSAFVNFPVNSTILAADYMRNRGELARITGTIDSVRGDADITITSISIHGFASPEGPFKVNDRLAAGRTASLKDYVESLYHFRPGFIHTGHTAENWAGLEQYLQKAAIADGNEILAIVDSALEPDAKEAAIRKRFPEQYAELLANVFPTLRRSDYEIAYTIRSYTSLTDILRVLKEAPQKLSLSEFYRAAESMEAGSEEFNEVFETAVRMYPADSVANLNAANTAMRRGEYDVAERYLAKAGDSPVAVYSRGVLSALRNDFTTAVSFFEKARNAGYAPAADAIEHIKEVQRFADGKAEIIR